MLSKVNFESFTQLAKHWTITGKKVTFISDYFISRPKRFFVFILAFEALTIYMLKNLILSPKDFFSFQKKNSTVSSKKIIFCLRFLCSLLLFIRSRSWQRKAWKTFFNFKSMQNARIFQILYVIRSKIYTMWSSCFKPLKSSSSSWMSINI